MSHCSLVKVEVSVRRNNQNSTSSVGKTHTKEMGFKETCTNVDFQLGRPECLEPMFVGTSSQRV